MKSLPFLSRLFSITPTMFPLLLGICSLPISSPATQTQEIAVATVYDFGGNLDGSKPDSLVLGSDGNFYGTTGLAGKSGYGTIFKLTPAGQINTLYNFAGGNDGGIPNPGLVQDGAGNFYGTTAQNGLNNNGTVFRLTPSGTLTTLHSFTSSEGGWPVAGLVSGGDGFYYGSTETGGIYRISASGDFSLLASTNYFLSSGLILGQDGNLYGIVSGGPKVFRVTTAGVVTTVGTGPVNAFTYGDTLIQGSDGNFYGTTGGGGSNNGGTVFRMTPDGTYTLLHTFNDSNQGEITTNSKLLEGSDGNFYGATSTGGVNNDGTLYRVTPDGGFTELYDFYRFTGFGPEESGNANPQAGAALVTSADGNLWGTNVGGGLHSAGRVFKTAPLPGFFTGAVTLARGVSYLTFGNGNYFGYYSFLADPNYLYHFDLGYEYVFDANDGKSGVYLYDFASGGFFYTSPTFPFPYLYDFSLNSVVYYYPDPTKAGRYNTNGVRYFYVFNTGKIISK